MHMITGTRLQTAITIQLLIVIIAIVVGVFVARANSLSVQASIESALAAKEEHMMELSTLTDRNAASEEVAAIITDCPRRADYDAYLMRLSSLNKQELITMQNLFESCSPFYIGQKALMVTMLRQEYEDFGAYMALLDELSDIAPLGEKHERFGALVELEIERSDLMTEQTRIQGEIIRNLISGKGIQSAEVAALVQEAQEVAESLSVTDRRADDIRGQLSS